MRIFYLLNQRYPTEKGYGLQVSFMCNAFVESGAEVELVVPDRPSHITKDPRAYYDLEVRVAFRRVAMPHYRLLNVFGGVGVYIKNYLSARRLVASVVREDGLIYTRDESVASEAITRGASAVLELHRFSDARVGFYKRFLRHSTPIVAISNGIKQALLRIGFREEDILVAHDGVNRKEYEIQESQLEARQKTELPTSGKIALYTGHLYDWKGTQTILDAAAVSPDVTYVLVGGTEQDCASYRSYVLKQKLGNVMIVGHKPYTRMPLYMRAADVLLLPNSAREAISKLYTSPIKLFMYMAAKKPIVASDLPSLREVIDESTAFMVPPDDAMQLARAVTHAIMDLEESRTRSERAFARVLDYSWSERAKAIRSFVQQKILR